MRNTHPAELQVSSCHGELLRNSRAGRPLVIAGQEYRHGLLAHAPSKLVVQLDSPGKTFSAIVGVDSNEQTRQGQGSVVFVVTVGGKVAAQSAVLREGMNGVPVVVDLGGATSFVLEATDAGDGIACDHADWAEAKVTFADGREQSLGDLPPASEGGGLPFSFVYGGTASRWLLPLWEREDETEALDAKRVQRTTNWKDAKTGLEVSCKSIEYRDFPVVEWTLHFRNGGTAETPIIEDIRALDVRIEKPPGGDFLLRGCRGDNCTPDSYQPYATPFTATRPCRSPHPEAGPPRWCFRITTSRCRAGVGSWHWAGRDNGVHGSPARRRTLPTLWPARSKPISSCCQVKRPAHRSRPCCSGTVATGFVARMSGGDGWWSTICPGATGSRLRPTTGLAGVSP